MIAIVGYEPVVVHGSLKTRIGPLKPGDKYRNKYLQTYVYDEQMGQGKRDIGGSESVAQKIYNKQLREIIKQYNPLAKLFMSAGEQIKKYKEEHGEEKLQRVAMVLRKAEVSQNLKKLQRCNTHTNVETNTIAYKHVRHITSSSGRTGFTLCLKYPKWQCCTMRANLNSLTFRTETSSCATMTPH
jgi:predicted Zn-ribbon and HTH transcriptional regulator